MLGVSRVSIWRWIRDGRLPVLRLGPRTTRIRRQDVDRLLSVRADDAARPRDESARAPGAGGWTRRRAPHLVQFYEADTVLLDALTEYIGAGLQAGEAGIVIATPAHRAALEQRLRAQGLDLEGRARPVRRPGRGRDPGAPPGRGQPGRRPGGRGALRRGRGRPHRRRRRWVGRRCAPLARWSRCWWRRGTRAPPWRWKRCGPRCSRRTPSRSCAPTRWPAWTARRTPTLLGAVCAAHGHVIPAESYTRLPTVDARLRAIAALQQQARSLQAALAAETAARAAAEEALRVRDEFLSIAAHELRTPLTSLSWPDAAAAAPSAARGHPGAGPVGPGAGAHARDRARAWRA